MIVRDMNRPVGTIPFIAGETVTLAMEGVKAPDIRIHQYRQCFVEIVQEDVLSIFNSGSEVLSVQYSERYIEDENGNQLSESDIYRYVAGSSEPVAMGDPKTVVALGPSDICSEDEWETETSNTFELYLSVIENLLNSRWLRSPVSVSFHAPSAGEAVVLSALFPDEEMISAVVLRIRMLYEDGLFKAVCKYYLRHCSDSRKRIWISCEKDVFVESLNNRPTFPFDVPMSKRDILESFLYGTGRVHHKPRNSSAKCNMQGILNRLGKERSKFVIESVLRDVYINCARSYSIINQDYQYWRGKYDLPGASIVDV